MRQNGSADVLERILLADESVAPTTERPSLRVLEQKSVLLKRLAQLALRRGDWDRAARLEEHAVLTEHRAALLREGLLTIFGDN